MNNLPIKIAQQMNFDLSNSAIAITTIIALSTVCCFRMHIDAKYNRETVLSYNESGFNLTSRPVTINLANTCLA